jgi:hypothetical protein
MFTTAGFNVNRLKMFILDDADQFEMTLKQKIMRISNSIVRTTYYFSEQLERIEILAEKC